MDKLLLGILFLLSSSELSSQETGSLTGTISDKLSGDALPGATITIQRVNLSVSTNNRGYFRIDHLAPGVYLVMVSYVGYEMRELPITINAGIPTVIQTALTPQEMMGNAVVVSASRRTEKITQAPASIRVIGKQQLDAFAGSNVFQLAAYQQGVEFVRTGIDYVALNARGFSKAANNKLVQIVDARNSTTTASSNLPMYNFSTLNKLDIDRMEIVLGPQAALFGPNAQNAVINVILKDPRKEQGTTVAVSGGNHYQFAARFRQATKINEHWAYKLTGEYSAGEDFIFFDSVYAGGESYGPPTVIPERNVNFAFRRIRGEAHLWYSPTAKTDIILSAGKSDNISMGVSTIGRNQVRGINPYFLQARLTHPRFFATIYNTWSTLGNSFGLYPYTRTYWNLTNANPPVSPDIAEATAMRGSQMYENNQRLNAEAQYNYLFQQAGIHLVAGWSFQKESPHSRGTTLVDKQARITVTQWGGVVQLEKSMPHDLRFIGAARLDHHSNFGNLFSPKLGITKTLKGNTFRLTWAKAYSVPSVFIQYANLSGIIFGNGPGIRYIPNGSKWDETTFLTTQALIPEEINTWEIGYKGTPTGKLFLDINAYYGRSKNFQSSPLQVDGRALAVGDIAVTPAFPGTIDSNGRLQDARFSTYFNYGKVATYGLDIGLDYSFSKMVRLTLNYSWFGSGISKEDPDNDSNMDGFVTTEERSLNAPQHRGLAALQLLNLWKQKLMVRTTARFTQQYDYYTGNLISTAAGEGKRGIVYRGDLPAIIKNFDWGPLGGFAVVDLDAGYKWNERVTLTVNVTNLFDVKQREFPNSPYIGRLLVAEVKVHLPGKK